jgi:hypothetical protein
MMMIYTNNDDDDYSDTDKITMINIMLALQGTIVIMNNPDSHIR